MKRFVLFVLGCAFALMVAPALAQSPTGEVILLDDGTPSVTANVTLPQNATGVVSLNLNNAAVTITDSNGKAIFQMSDGRVHNIELSIAANSGAQIIKVERLPGVAQAGVSITALSEFSSSGATAQSVSTNSLTTNQEQTIQLDSLKPGATVQVNIPADSTGVVTSTYFGAN